MAAHLTKHYSSDDGLELFCRDFPCDSTRAPVVCLPGLTRNSRDFEDFNPRIATVRRVLSPDFRGRGYSSWDPNWRNYHPATYVNDVWTLMHEMGIDRSILVGTSLGGLVAMIMAAQHPERVVAIVLNDVGPEVAAEGLARISQYSGKLPPVSNWREAREQAREVYGIAWRDLDEDYWDRLARRGYRERGSGKPRLDMDPNIGRALREIGPGTDDLWQVFAALDEIPVLVLRGAMSDILSDDILTEMKTRKLDLHVAVIPNRGHVPLLDEPESLTAVDRFLAELP